MKIKPSVLTILLVTCIFTACSKSSDTAGTIAAAGTWKATGTKSIKLNLPVNSLKATGGKINTSAVRSGEQL